MSGTVEELRDRLAGAETAYDIREFMRPDDFMSCPCFLIDLPGFRAEGHCWRPICADGHPYSCVHVDGDPAMAERLRDVLTATNWYGEWGLSVRPDQPGDTAERGAQ